MRLITYITLLALCPVLIQAQPFAQEAAQHGVLASHGDNVTFGGGISAYDFNGDGMDDLSIATEPGQPILFYQNSPTGFQQVTFPGITEQWQTKQLSWADFDNDGDPDLFASSSRGENILYVNDGSMAFSPMIFPKSTVYADTSIASYGATFVDLDRDGYLDLFVTHYDNRPGVPNQLFMNNGNGTFNDVTAACVFSSYYHKTFCSSIVDYDNDLEADIYLAEDRQNPNLMFRNLGGGFLTDVSASTGTDVIVNAMGIAVGDFDMDRDLDLYISNTPQGNPLLQNNGNGTFTRIDSLVGVSYNRVGWGVNFLDYDNDADLDLYVSGSTDIDRVQSQLFVNDGAGMFQPCPGDSMPGDSTFSFANAIADFNGDGYPDIAVNNKGPDSVQVWYNQRSGNHWLKLGLIGTTSNRDGIGSWIEIHVGGQQLVRYRGNASSFVSQNSRQELFGLGSETVVDSIHIRWPSGIEDNWYNVPADHVLEFVEGSSITAQDIAASTNIRIWPQPAADRINLELPANHDFQQIELLDLQGRVLKQMTVAISARTLQMDANGLSNGIYLLRFRSEGYPLVRRIEILR